MQVSGTSFWFVQHGDQSTTRYFLDIFFKYRFIQNFDEYTHFSLCQNIHVMLAPTPRDVTWHWHNLPERWARRGEASLLFACTEGEEGWLRISSAPRISTGQYQMPALTLLYSEVFETGKGKDNSIVQQVPSTAQLTLISLGPGVLGSFTRHWKKKLKALGAREGIKAATGSCSPCWLYIAYLGRNRRWLVCWSFFPSEVTINKLHTHHIKMERSGDSGSQTPNYAPPGSPNSLQQSAPFPFCHKTLFQGDPMKSSSSAPVTPQCHCPAVSSHSYSAFLPLSLPPWAIWSQAEHSPAAFRPGDPSMGPASPYFTTCELGARRRLSAGGWLSALDPSHSTDKGEAGSRSFPCPAAPVAARPRQQVRQT